MAANLTSAADLSYARLSVKWAAFTLPADLQSFIVAAAPFFDDNVPSDRPVGNWLVLLTAVRQNMVGMGTPLPQEIFNTCVDYVYKMCFAGATAQSQSRISGTQAAGLLAAWITYFGP